MFGVDFGLLDAGWWSLTAAVIFFFWTRFDMRSERVRILLREDQYRKELADRLSSSAGWGERYRNALVRQDAHLSRFFGSRFLGLKAFDRCLFIAYIYPVVFFVFAFMAGGETEIAGQAAFPDNISGGERTIYGLFLFIIGGIALFLTRRLYMRPITHWDKLPRNKTVISEIIDDSKVIFNQRPKNEIKNYFLLAALLIIIVITNIFSFKYDFRAATAIVVVAFLISSILGVKLLGIILLFWTTAGTILALAIQLFTNQLFVFLNSLEILIPWYFDVRGFGFAVILLILIPLMNAVFDFLSWAVSRAFIRSASIRGATWLVGVEAIGDLLIGGVCLAGLVSILPNIIEVYNQVFPTSALDWLSLASVAATAPFGAGLMVTATIFSTLIPTALHFFWGMIGIIAAPTSGYGRMAEELRSVPNGETPSLELMDRAVSVVRRQANWLPIAAAASAAVLGLVLALFLWVFPNIAGALIDLAVCSTAWKPEHSCGPLLEWFVFSGH